MVQNISVLGSSKNRLGDPDARNQDDESDAAEAYTKQENRSVTTARVSFPPCPS